MTLGRFIPCDEHGQQPIRDTQYDRFFPESYPENPQPNSEYHPDDTAVPTSTNWRSLAREGLTLPDRCPRCNDELVFRHVRADYRVSASGDARHVLSCVNFPRCSYTTDYDPHLYALLHLLGDRLIRCEAQIAWLTIELEAVREVAL
jgi:hypothetical protein